MTELVCIVCPRGCRMKIDEANGFEVSGNSCPRGADYGRKELTDPHRMVTSTIEIESESAKRLPVKTKSSVPKGRVMDIMDVIRHLKIKAPVKCGDSIVTDILGLGTDIVACRTIER